MTTRSWAARLSRNFWRHLRKLPVVSTWFHSNHSELIELEKYPKNWDAVVKSMCTEWIDNDVTKELSRRVPDLDIATVIWGCMKDDSLPWLDYKMPAAGRKTPMDLMESEEGKAEIRWILVSNPWWSAVGKRNESI